MTRQLFRTARTLAVCVSLIVVAFSCERTAQRRGMVRIAVANIERGVR